MSSLCAAARGVGSRVGNISCCERRLSGTAMNSSVVTVTTDVWPLRLAKEAGKHGRFGVWSVDYCCTCLHSCGNISYCRKSSDSGTRSALVLGRCMTSTLATEGHRLGRYYSCSFILLSSPLVSGAHHRWYIAIHGQHILRMDDMIVHA